MARKAAVTATASADAPSAEASALEGSARRSTRLAEKPVSAVAADAPKKVNRKTKKRAVEGEEEDELDEEPASKKAKPTSKADHAAKPSSKAAAKAVTKPASKASKGQSAAEAPADESDKVTEAILEEKEDEAEGDKESKKEEPQPAAEEDEIKELQIGDNLPDWTFKNEKDEDVVISQLAGEKGLVLFLIPKANTPGCTTQACGFRDAFPDFEKYGYAVFALSNDTPAAQAKWQTKQNLNYPLLSDPKRKLIEALGAKTGTSTKRSHLIFEKGTGKLVEKKIGVKPSESPKDALAFIQKLHPNDSLDTAME